jgi:hypothetical protein
MHNLYRYSGQVGKGAIQNPPWFDEWIPDHLRRARPE